MNILFSYINKIFWNIGKSLTKFLFELINDINFEKNILALSLNCFEHIRKDDRKQLKQKSDGSPLGSADLELDNIIRNKLLTFSSKIPIISEELSVSDKAYQNNYYWLIDPIDGTKSYLSGGSEYSINIALILEGKPYFGLIAHPPTERIWYTKNKEVICLKKGLKKIIRHNSRRFPEKLKIITSKEYNKDLENLINLFKTSDRVKLSSSLKFCELAEKNYDIYPRISSISKWDIGAGHAILAASGGSLIKKNGKCFKYNTETSKTGSFIAISDKDWSTDLIALVKQHNLF